MISKSPQNARVGKIRSSYAPIINQLTVQQVRLASSDIEKWRGAINAAKSVLNPRRHLLYELYESIELDGHLLSVMNMRRMQISNKKVHFSLKNNEGEEDEVVKTSILETPWFYDMIKYMLTSKSNGHALIELIPEQGIISRAKLVPRANVIPETGLLAFNSYAPSTGIDFRNDPFYSNYLIEAGGERDLGLLSSAAQYVIYKRGGFGDWSQFAELFGMPFREGNYQPYDEEGRKKLEDALANMGGAGWVATPEGTTIKFHDNNGAGKSEVFKDLVDKCDEQISKIFLGNTMTTDNGSSRSQADVHQDSQDSIIQCDMVELEFLLNWSVKNKLIALGLPIPEGKFYFPDAQILSLDKRIEMDIKLSEKVSIPDEYWYKTYGIPKPDGKDTITVPAGTKQPDIAPEGDTGNPPAKPTDKKPLKKDPKKAPEVKAQIKIAEVEAYNKRTEVLAELFNGMKEINAIYTHANHS